MVAELSDILMDDTDALPDAEVTETPTKRGRGRPRGSGSSGSSGGRSSAPRRRSSIERTGQAPRMAGARELAGMLTQVIGGLSIGFALLVSVDEIAMTTDEARSIGRPLARIIMQSPWAEQAMSLIDKGGSDYGKLIWASVLYGIRIYPLLVQRQQALDLMRQRGSHVTGGAPTGVRNEQQTYQQGNANAGQGGGGNVNRGGAPEPPPVNFAAVAGAGLRDADTATAGTYGDIGAVIRAATAQ